MHAYINMQICTHSNTHTQPMHLAFPQPNNIQSFRRTRPQAAQCIWIAEQKNMHDFVFEARSYLCRSAHLVTCCHIKVMMYVQVHYYIANSTMGWSQSRKEREREWQRFGSSTITWCVALIVRCTNFSIRLCVSNHFQPIRTQGTKGQ